MSHIRNIKLEILRPGPAHNQLLSPLTPYLALCGADGPVTLNLPFEQRQLRLKLDRLRYSTDESEIPKSQREGELRELGETIGQILGQVPALLTELGNARTGEDTLVHLRLSLSAYELGLIPFEIAIAQNGFPGAGSPLFLQSNTPVALTREVRRGTPLPVSWNQKPRILFAFAAPDGLPRVPADHHLKALRRAIAPWLKIKGNTADQIREVKRHITLLPNASLGQIQEACSREHYTHVHLLAHGARYKKAGDTRYGIALFPDNSPVGRDVVDGERLATALTLFQGSPCPGSDRPTMVTLATCDSANAKSVITPGGSIAHELHAAGIPWVFASQFPMWMSASTLFTQLLYTQLLQGNDPRCALHELRQRLRISCPKTHDWASVVAYATLPWDFGDQVARFRDAQTQRKIDIRFARMDEIQSKLNPQTPPDQAVLDEISALTRAIRTDLEEWRRDAETDEDRAKRLGQSAASEKRMGVAQFHVFKDKEKSIQSYENSCRFYKDAMKAGPNNHWLITQYLSMRAVLRRFKHKENACTDEGYNDLWQATRRMNQWWLPHTKGRERIWAHATLAELELLGVIYGGSEFDAGATQEEIHNCCRAIAHLCQPGEFPLLSTRRQFLRYTDAWQHPPWTDLAQTAVDALDK